MMHPPFVFQLSCVKFAAKVFSMGHLKDLYIKRFGCEPQSLIRLTGDGSNRVYYRMAGEVPAIGVVGTSVEENRAFVALSKAFRQAGVAAPEVFAVSDDELCYLQEDLGMSLFTLRCRLHAREVSLMRRIAGLCAVLFRSCRRYSLECLGISIFRFAIRHPISIHAQ